MSDIWSTIAELAPALARGDLSPVEVTRTALDRCAQLEPTLDCFITLEPEAALAQARAAEAEIRAGRYRGPLHGVPLAIKDNLATAGLRTTGGSTILADYVPTADAPAVARLRAAGAIVLGKTNLHELGMGGTSINPHYGPSRNPWNPDLITGGSSGGSAAAVAAGLCPAALGTDAGGSVRIPASLCGVVGVKPTHGRVPIRGCLGAANPTVDHIGPLTRSVADAALVLHAIAGVDPADPTTVAAPSLPEPLDLTGDLTGLRVGVPRDYYWDGVDPAVALPVRTAIDQLAALGATLVDVNLPDQTILIDGTAGLAGERVAYYRDWMQERLADYGHDVQVSLLVGQFVPASDYALALRARRVLAERYATVLATVHLLATPTTVVAALPIAQADTTRSLDPALEAPPLAHNTRPANLTGLPALSVPAGFTADGRPVGLQLIGRAFDEATLLRAGAAYEQATDWHRRHPPINQ
jgi:aspartyl-tRNA(Asn)/glutamyl-tRNA(Gln) amidotransferase subunit A